MKKIVIAAACLVLVGMGLFIFLRSKDNGVKFKTVAIQSGSLKATVTATGTMNAVTTVLVGTQASGTIKQLHVDFNSRVKKGQIIAEIDPATFQAQVDQAKANLLAAQANVAKAKATQTDSKRTRDRNRQLFAKDLIARADLDTSEATYDSNDALLSAAFAQVSQNEAALRYAETNLRYTKIMSPVDGVVVSRAVDVGQTVAASFQTPTLFTIAQDLTKMQIDTNIDEADVGKIRVGQNVEFTVDAYPDNTFRGIVDQIRIAPITVQNVVTYDVVIKVDNNDLRLMPGMTANVSVIVASKDGILKIPNVALRYRPSEKDGTTPTKPANDKAVSRSQGTSDKSGKGRDGGKGDGRSDPPQMTKEASQPAQKSYAIYLLENGKPRRSMVTIGISDGSMTEITSGDVTEGQQVIVESVSKTAAKTNGNSTPPPPRFIR
ncbi:MAG TPA: efflux RND transporter periplasmic adaptor subunit [Syntrophorhabdaceae bacterium]|nr:efflux RND transporter periplasmic adaptor subunit [Syntrophorhabdaceae bacterium]